MYEEKFHNKVVVVSGGGSGMGHEVAVRMARHGAKVCLFDINTENLEKTKRELEKLDKQILIVECNISVADQVEKGFKKVYDHWNKIDILFANAGIAGSLSPIETMEVKEWEKTINTNLKGTFLTVKYAIPYLKQQGGSIIVTSSVSGNRMFSQTGFSAYSTTKASQVALMKMAALELSSYKIRVNAICPGGIKTNISKSIHKSTNIKDIEMPVEFPAGDQPLEHKPGNTEQIADLVEFLASEQSNHITGTEIYIDGGESLLHG